MFPSPLDASGGGIAGKHFMISYELFVLLTTPTFFLYFLINGWRYIRFRLPMDKVLLAACLYPSLTNLV
jgi:hypothetical protein